MHIHRVIDDKSNTQGSKLSERCSGCLSKERTEELQNELSQMRKEWGRNSY